METIVYSKWERVKKLYKGKEITQIMPISHRESLTQLILNLSQELEKLAEHLFVAAWQHNEFSMLQKNVPQSWVVLNMDFAENYSCVAQQEVQSAHWSPNQVTLHSTVAYYRCPEEGCEQIVTEHLIFVSDDKSHDAAAVLHFVKLANEHLIHKRSLSIEKEIQLTDGCAAQYKSKTPFTDISFSKTDFGFPVERHFYGSRHGKGPADGAGAVMKSVVKRAVMGGNVVVNNSTDFYEYAKGKLTKEDENHKEHFKRTLFHVANIDHNRPERTDRCKTLKGTRKVQAVQPVDNMIVNTRNLSCFCDACIDDVPGCENSNYVQVWNLHDLQKLDQRAQRARGGARGRTPRGRPATRRGRGGVQRGRGGPRTRGGAKPRGRGGARKRGGAKSTVDDFCSDSESDVSVPELDSSSDTHVVADSEDSEQSIMVDCQTISRGSVAVRLDSPGYLAGYQRGPRTRGGVRTRGRGSARKRGGAKSTVDDFCSDSESDVSVPELDSSSDTDVVADSEYSEQSIIIDCQTISRGSVAVRLDSPRILAGYQRGLGLEGA